MLVNIATRELIRGACHDRGHMTANALARAQDCARIAKPPWGSPRAELSGVSRLAAPHAHGDRRGFAARLENEGCLGIHDEASLGALHKGLFEGL